MKIEFLQDQKVGSHLVDLLKGTASVPTNRWLLTYGGTGELGPPDGSQIMDMDNYFYQKYPYFDPDFNILSPQAYKSYGEFDENIIDYLVSLGAEQIVIVGFSLGAQEVINWIMKYNGRDTKGKVVGFVPVAGQRSWPLLTDVCQAVDVPVMAIASDKDTAIGCVQSFNTVEFLNSCPTRKNKAIYRMVPGLSHTETAVWAFTPDKNHEVYKFIMSCFAPEVKENVGRIVLLDDGTVQAIFQDGSTRTIEAY